MSDYDGTNVISTSTSYCSFDCSPTLADVCEQQEQGKEQVQEQEQEQQQYSGGAGELGSSLPETLISDQKEETDSLSCDDINEKLADESIYSEDGLAKYTCENYTTEDGVSWIKINGTSIPLSILYEHLYDTSWDDDMGAVVSEAKDETEALDTARKYELVLLSVVTSSITGFIVIALGIYTYYIMRGVCQAK